MDTNERNLGTTTGFSPDMVEERVKANLQLFHTQISALTEMMDKLIHGNSAREFTTASTQKSRLQSESPVTEAPRTPRFPPVAPLTTSGYWPDNGLPKIPSTACQKYIYELRENLKVFLNVNSIKVEYLITCSFCTSSGDNEQYAVRYCFLYYSNS